MSRENPKASGPDESGPCPFCTADVVKKSLPTHLTECEGAPRDTPLPGSPTPTRDVETDDVEGLEVLDETPLDAPGGLNPGGHAGVNGRGPFRVREAVHRPPEVLTRTEDALTVRLTHARTGTDWMVVEWDSEPDAWLYVRTADGYASRGFRFRKVEEVRNLASLSVRGTASPER